VIAAALRLYFDSFFYTLILSIIATMTFFSVYYVAVTYFTLTNDRVLFIMQFLPSLISLIFFIPLVKRIYSVGSELPITTNQAFSGFFVHYFRMAIFIILCILASSIIPATIYYLNPKLPPITSGFAIYLLVCGISFIYIYVTLRLYFTSMFIILENKPILESIKLSFKISQNHIWLTFWVIAMFAFGYWTVTSLFSNILVWEALGLDLVKEAFTVISLPLFLCIQIAQFFNLKKLLQQSTTQPS
jgi:hypothetical protein